MFTLIKVFGLEYKGFLIKSNNKNIMKKIKCYTMSQGTSKFIDKELENILEYLKSEIEENLEESESIEFSFGIEYMMEEEFNNLIEFDGF